MFFCYSILRLYVFFCNQIFLERPQKPKRFYNFARDATTGGRELFIDGEIAQDLWFGDECTPGLFRNELFSDNGDITLWISSPGGDVRSDRALLKAV
jgi:ATP-dependent protease ClpP protease subunit